MKSVLIIGLGRFGRHMARTLIENGNSVLGIESKEERAEAATEILSNIQIANATDETFIRSLGVDNFDLCVVAIGDNFQSALEITVLLHDHGAKFILARATRDVHRKLLLRNGASEVVYAERDIAERMAIKYGNDSIFDYVVLTENVGIYEIKVPESWLGKSIIEKAIRSKYNLSILATKKNGDIFPLPHPNHIFAKDETLMVLGNKKDIMPLVK